MRTNKRHQRGNALFLILIAVALFAALSYVITQSGRGSGTLDKETALISAGQLTEYPATLRAAATRMIITGLATSSGTTGVDLDTTPSGATNQIFDSAGGGMIVMDPPVSSGATAWTFISAVHATDGFYIKDVGTNTSVTGRETIAVAQGVSLAVCKQIDRGLGVASPYTPPPVAVNMVWATPLGSYDATKANVLSGAGIDAEAFLCVNNDKTGGAAGPYHYFHALVEQ